MTTHTHVLANQRANARSAFTLIEILIVVAILGILAATVVPQFVRAVTDSQDNSIAMNVHRIRSQIGVYRQQHNAYPTLANFSDQMTLSSDAVGATAAVGTPGFIYGPYLRFIPRNSNTGASLIGGGAIGTSDWYYDENTGAFHGNDSATSFAF